MHSGVQYRYLARWLHTPLAQSAPPSLHRAAAFGHTQGPITHCCTPRPHPTPRHTTLLPLPPCTNHTQKTYSTTQPSTRQQRPHPTHNPSTHSHKQLPTSPRPPSITAHASPAACCPVSCSPAPARHAAQTALAVHLAATAACPTLPGRPHRALPRSAAPSPPGRRTPGSIWPAPCLTAACTSCGRTGPAARRTCWPGACPGRASSRAGPSRRLWGKVGKAPQGGWLPSSWVLSNAQASHRRCQSAPVRVKACKGHGGLLLHLLQLSAAYLGPLLAARVGQSPARARAPAWCAAAGAPLPRGRRRRPGAPAAAAAPPPHAGGPPPRGPT